MDITSFVIREFFGFLSCEYKSLSEMPVADWISILAEGHAEYKKSPSRKQMKSTYFEAKK